MHDARSSLDVVVRGDDGTALILVADRSGDDHLGLRGTLIDPESLGPVDTRIDVTIDPEFPAGAHVERDGLLTVVVDGQQYALEWHVQTLELADGYVLHDARVAGSGQFIRAFAIEDLIATVGIGLGAGVAAIFIYRSHRRQKQAWNDAELKWSRCVESGGTATKNCKIRDGVRLGPSGLTIGSEYEVSVTCAPPGS
jgi:hypothetical protein